MLVLLIKTEKREEKWEKCQPRLRCKDADVKKRQKDNDQRDCPE